MPDFAKHYREAAAKSRTFGDEGASAYVGRLAGEVNEAVSHLDEIADLVELADSKPELYLAVVEKKQGEREDGVWWTYYEIVKMEGE